jgi:hypothetical protein
VTTPQEPDAPGLPDPLGLIAAAVPLGVLAGTLTVTGTVFLVTILRERAPGTAAPDPTAASPLYVLLAGTFLGVLVAAGTTSLALAPVRNVYRRVMFGTVSAFATVVAMLITTPVHAFLGRPGLVGLALLCLVGITLLGRRVARLRTAH